MGQATENEPEEPNQECCQGSCGCAETTQPEEKSSLLPSQIIDIDAIKPNSLVILRLKGSMNADISAMVGEIWKRYSEKFTALGVSVIIVDEKKTLEVMDEAIMNEAGWFKRGLIITP